MFRRDRRGVVLEADGTDLAVLADLAAQVESLVAPEPSEPVDPLVALVGIDPSATRPDDPALARLLPDAFLDDADAADEFRRFTEADLRARKAADARAVRERIAAVTGGAGKLRLGDDEARQWLGFLNDVRLVLGTRLAVTEEPIEVVEDDPRLPYLGVYAWLGVLQETLVESLVPRHP